VLQQPRAIGGIAIPIVGPERIDTVALSAQLRHQHILRNQTPARLAARMPRIKAKPPGQSRAWCGRGRGAPDSWHWSPNVRRLYWAVHNRPDASGTGARR